MAKIPAAIQLDDSDLDQLMQTEPHLRIATLGPDTDINLTPMTFGWAGGRVYIYGRGQKIANLRRNSTTTVLVDVGSHWRELRGIMMRGHGCVLETAQQELDDPWLKQAQLNLGAKHQLIEEGVIQAYQATASGNSRRWIVFTPAKVVSWDNAKLAG